MCRSLGGENLWMIFHLSNDISNFSLIQYVIFGEGLKKSLCSRNFKVVLCHVAKGTHSFYQGGDGPS